MKTISYKIQIVPHTLHFKQPAGTSRGTYTIRKIWYLLLTSKEEPGRTGIGECAPLPALSCDDLPDYEQILVEACRRAEQDGKPDREALRPYPSILFGLETAFRHYETGSPALWDTPFSRGEAGIPINGLIWMGEYKKMLEQIETKMQSGFRCIKLKIGAIHFEEELELLRYIRAHFSHKEVELRVDANGAFSPSDALDKLNRLAALDLHSIEQPIRAGQWEEMARLTASTPLPIALDEELIGCNTPEGKKLLLETIRPQYIILKPSLHGGISGGMEWIAEAERQQTGWWITSALESNIGLNAIAQWCATLNNPLPQGLGTGALFTDNIELPLTIRRDCLFCSTPAATWKCPVEANGIPFARIKEEKNAPIILDGISYSPEEISKLVPGETAIPAGEMQHLQQFLREWYDASPFLTVQTSGSTGIPKKITVRKEQMIQSALQTCKALHLQPGDKALLCMPLQYIAGKMMVVRALVGGLDLIVRTPSGHPMAEVDMPLRFAAMIPLQVYNTLQVPEEKARLSQTDILIIGGGSVDTSLEAEISRLPVAVYSTYGMTETLSHIALRRLNGPEASLYYTPFSSVSLSLSPDNTLVIDAPLICDQRLVTNDVARINPDGSFVILGRKDNIINSGGIKVQAETVEEALRPLLSTDYVITSVPHPKFGEAIVLLLVPAPEAGINTASLVNETLPKYQRPKYILETTAIPRTGSGKTDRAACRDLALDIITKTR